MSAEKISSYPALILVDGSSYLFRAYYALPALMTSENMPTGAIYGVINMLRKLITDYPPQHIAVVFDPKGPTFRKDLYPLYKANRTQMPNELQVQIPILFELIKAMGFPLIIKEGVEADDVIATLAKQASQQNLSVLISTGDKDLAQIVDENVTLVNTMSNTLLDPEGVVKKFGVRPDQIIDYLALVGDSSDNIPGILGCGPKTAEKWLKTHDTLDNLLNNIDEIKGKVGENLRAQLKDLSLFRELVTVKDSVQLEEKIESLCMQEQNPIQLIELFTKLEFKNWLAEILAETKSVAVDQHSKSYETILEENDFLKWIEKLKSCKEFALDTETTSITALECNLVGLSFAVAPGEAVYIPVGHHYVDVPQQLEKSWVLKQLQPIFMDKEKILIGQNIKYDFEVLNQCGIEFKNKIRDTMLESYILNSTAARHDLNTLSLKYLGRNPITFEEVAGKKSTQVTFDQVAIEKATEYAAEDADLALQLHRVLMPKILDSKELSKVFLEIELPLVFVLMRMEMRGVMIDAQQLQAQSEKLGERINELETSIFAQAGCQFNINSPKQLQTVLYEKLQLPILQKTPSGQPSTGEEVLQELAEQYALPQLILSHRTLSKLKSTYTDKLPLQVNSRTGRIHTSYNQAVTATGRLSSNHPNLQNIPIRTEEGRKIRQAFVAPQGYQIVAADYSQVELRIIAHSSQDEGLMRAFANHVDIHQATAAEVFDVALTEVTPDQRRSAKAINFGLLYGMSAFGLAKQLGIERGLAQKYIDIYFLRYPKVQAYLQSIRELAARQGYVETLFGRRLYVPDINSSNIQRRRAAERIATNGPMQGTAADIIKKAMLAADQWIQESGIDVYMIMQVHDELVFEVATEVLDEAIKKIKQYMETTVILSVPLLVDVGVGLNWDEAH